MSKEYPPIHISDIGSSVFRLRMDFIQNGEHKVLHWDVPHDTFNASTASLLIKKMNRSYDKATRS